MNIYTGLLIIFCMNLIFITPKYCNAKSNIKIPKITKKIINIIIPILDFLSLLLFPSDLFSIYGNLTFLIISSIAPKSLTPHVKTSPFF